MVNVRKKALAMMKNKKNRALGNFLSFLNFGRVSEEPWPSIHLSANHLPRETKLQSKDIISFDFDQPLATSFFFFASVGLSSNQAPWFGTGKNGNSGNYKLLEKILNS